mgnify:FL=1
MAADHCLQSPKHLAVMVCVIGPGASGIDMVMSIDRLVATKHCSPDLKSDSNRDDYNYNYDYNYKYGRSYCLPAKRFAPGLHYRV